MIKICFKINHIKLLLSHTRRVHFLLAPLKNLSEVSKFCHLHFSRRKKIPNFKKKRNT